MDDYSPYAIRIQEIFAGFYLIYLLVFKLHNFDYDYSLVLNYLN